MNYPDSVEYLYALGNEHKAFKLGLGPVTRLLSALGDPQHAFRSVHVAGTNGKGSTAAMIASGLRQGGVRTGLFTSPHLVEPTERIRINGANVSHEQFSEAFMRVHETAEGLIRDGVLEGHPSYFETVTAMGFCLFRDEHIDTAVVEVGLGGRLDATNVIKPALSVITPIDYDHEAWLGSSLQSIATEKAGILKPGVPAVFARQRPEPDVVLTARARDLGCPVQRVADTAIKPVALRSDGSAFRLGGDLYDCGLAGRHQVENAAAAILALKSLGLTFGPISRGIETVRWPGRLEKVSSAPDIILDGAHNPAGARALAAYIREFFSSRPVVLVYGAMRDKSVEEITELLFPLATQVVITAPGNPRAVRPEALAEAVDHPHVRTVENIRSAIALVRNLSPETAVFITGSLYLVGEARALLVQ